VPGGRLLPLDLGGETAGVRSSEGVGLEPGDVDDGPIRMEWLEPGEAPLESEVRRPALWSGDVVVLLPRPSLVGPPFTPLVSTPFHKRQVRGVGDRRAADQVPADVGAMTR